MNHIYRLFWNASQQAYCAVTETAKGMGKSSGKVSTTVATVLLAACAGSAGATATNALPTGGQVTAGAAAISSTANSLTVTQGSQRAAINWQSFNIGSGATVNFVQPNASAVVLNRVVGNEQSVIAGAMNANGQVFLLNSNGVLFTGTSSVNVGGIVASTLNVSDADFIAGRNTFTASANKASVINLGTINAAEGGYVALLGNQVKNEGVITARVGTVVLAAGDKVSLNFNGDSLVGVTIDQGTLNALVENKQAIRADGGLVVLTAKGLDEVMRTAVNNTGEVRAQTVANKEGKIYLLGGMDNNRIEVGGTLDASAPNGGNGGFIETSAAKVKFADGAQITTAAANGTSGKWLIDPLDFTIAASGGDITGAALGTLLASNSIQIETATSPTGTSTNLVGASGTNGDINVNDAVSWSANNTLTLNAYRNININADITASGTTGKLALYYGRGALAASNTASYNLRGGHVNLQAGQNFDTKLGSDGALTNWTVITSLGSMGSTTGTDLQGLDTGTTTARTGNFVLGSNIDASATSTWNSNGSGGYFGFQPIAYAAAGAGGFTNSTFDGLGHTIDSLYINRSTVNTGLFSYAGGSTFRNISITNAHITGGAATGGLVGRIQGAASYIDQVDVAGTITGPIASGGLVGRDRGATNITNSYSTASVVGGASSGGLAGEFQGTISNSYASGPVAGTSYVGGLVGQLISTTTGSTGSFTFTPLVGRITNSYFDTTTTGQSAAYAYNTGTGVATPTISTDTTGAITNANAYLQASYIGFDFTSTGAWFSIDG